MEEVDVTSGKKSRDMIRKVALGVSFVLIGIENQEVVDYVFPIILVKGQTEAFSDRLASSITDLDRYLLDSK